jgi:hypothetical protein
MNEAGFWKNEQVDALVNSVPRVSFEVKVRAG